MTDLDEALTRKVAELLDRLESYLPKTMGVMTWVYNRTGADLDVQTFASHEGVAETLRIVRATASRLIAQEAKRGDAGVERYFELPAGGPPSDHLISSAAVSMSGGHDRVRLWSRGGLAGELVVTAGDGERVALAHGLVERA